MSDLLIRGIGMPTEKPIAVVIHPDGTAYCAEMLAGVCTEYLNDCVAIPVPPHGRLGDLDALAQQIEHDRFHHTHTDGLAARHHVAEYGHFLTAISYAPTVIPASKEGE